MAQRKWLAWELQFLRECYAEHSNPVLATVLGRTVGQVASRALQLGLKKSAAQRSRDANGKDSRFQKGIVPWNKGLHNVAGGRSAETRFKKGNRPSTWVPVGSYRVRRDPAALAYLERKVNDLPGPNHVRWHPVHRLVWEEANGPVPAGHIVVFKRGCYSIKLEEITLDRIELITRRELMARNTIHHMPPALADVARLRGRLTRAINDRAKEAESNG